MARIFAGVCYLNSKHRAKIVISIKSMVCVCIRSRQKIHCTIFVQVFDELHHIALGLVAQG